MVKNLFLRQAVFHVPETLRNFLIARQLPLKNFPSISNGGITHIGNPEFSGEEKSGGSSASAVR
jgi:hypothetical protein